MTHDPRTGHDRPPPGDDSGALPDGVRGTTRDVPYTVPQDESDGHPDPARPDSAAPDRTGTPRRDLP